MRPPCGVVGPRRRVERCRDDEYDGEHDERALVTLQLTTALLSPRLLVIGRLSRRRMGMTSGRPSRGGSRVLPCGVGRAHAGFVSWSFWHIRVLRSVDASLGYTRRANRSGRYARFSSAFARPQSSFCSAVEMSRTSRPCSWASASTRAQRRRNLRLLSTSACSASMPS